MLSECWLLRVNLAPFQAFSPSLSECDHWLSWRGAHSESLALNSDECSWRATVGKYVSLMSTEALVNSVKRLLVNGIGVANVASPRSVKKLEAAVGRPR